MSSIVQNNKKILTDDWKTLKFSDCILQLNTGLNPRNHFSLGSGEIKYITAKNLTKTGIIDFSKCDFINETAKKIINKRSEIQVGDILFSSRAPIGHCHLIKEEPDFYDIGESIFSIRANQDIIIPEYLCLYLSSDYFIKMASKQTTGSIISEIRISDLMNIEIIVPPKNIQMNIAKCIGEIDKKLQINNRINAELESMAKTIYDYWFTQFDFPDENGKPYKSSGGKMVWNEELKREIPEGWGVVSFSDLVSFEKGKIPEQLFEDKTGISFSPYLTIDVVNGGQSQYCATDKMPYCNGETIMVMDGAASGDVYVGNKGVLGSTFAMLKPKNQSYSNAMIYRMLKNNEIIYKKANTGSTVPHANRKFIEAMRIAVPTNIELFSKTFDTIQSKIEKCKEENQQLASLRDWLLPMLMNGQVGFEGVE